MATVKASLTGFLYIQLVADLFDAALISDMQEAEDGGTETIYYIGTLEELSAGLRGGFITPPYTDLEKLEDFCVRNWERLEYEASNGNTPDCTSWNAR